MSAASRSAEGRLSGVPLPALGVGVAALAACGVAGLSRPDQFFRSYLLAFVFWTSVAVGCLGALMMQYVTGGRWGALARRPLESASRTLPLLLALAVPILLGVHRLYAWARPDAVAADAHLAHKAAYLNAGYFAARTVAYLALWSGAGIALTRWSHRQDRTGDPRCALYCERLSGPGMFVLALTVSLAVVDWVMSLEPLWYSTIYAVVFMAGCLLAAFAVSIAVVALESAEPPVDDAARPSDFRDLGNLLLTFVMLWAYTAFSQFLLVWSGNLRDETPWYLGRTTGGWQWVALGLVVLHFFVPFFLLLSRRLKQDRRALALLALALLALHFVEMLWLVEPAFHPGVLFVSWMDAAATVGVGGLWVAAFVRFLASRPALPLRDPYGEVSRGR